jgi:hypothetical protein
MRRLQDYRSGKPASYPDQAVYAEYAAAQSGLSFAELDGGSGLVFSVASTDSRVAFGAGRCSLFPQNSATASTLATDKYFANVILERAGVATLGGQYFFLHDRYRAARGDGHERPDALDYFRDLGGAAFVKPLTGSRGDLTQAVHDETALARTLDEVSRYYDAVLLQRIFSGDEYRIFLLDDEVVYAARKREPVVTGDGVRTLAELLADHDAALRARGVSSVAMAAGPGGMVVPKGERLAIPGRMNLSAGGAMELAAPPDAGIALARLAARALGLRVAGVDLFTGVDGDAEAMRVIEVNANPSIRFLEQSGRDDLILTIWRHTFRAMGLLRV